MEKIRKNLKIFLHQNSLAQIASSAVAKGKDCQNRDYGRIFHHVRIHERGSSVTFYYLNIRGGMVRFWTSDLQHASRIADAHENKINSLDWKLDWGNNAIACLSNEACPPEKQKLGSELETISLDLPSFITFPANPGTNGGNREGGRNRTLIHQASGQVAIIAFTQETASWRRR